MPLQEIVEYDSKNAILYARYIGDVVLDDIYASQEAQARAIKKYNCNRILIDARNTNILISTIEYSYIADLSRKNYSKRGIDVRNLLRAFLVDELSENLEFFETVTFNQGLNIRVCTDKAEAIQWLLSTRVHEEINHTQS